MSGVASTPSVGRSGYRRALSECGQREISANAFRVNGANVLEDVNMGVAIVPVLDSIGGSGGADEQLSTRNWGTRAVGRSAVTTRSGGAKLHGSAYDYFRNTVLNARNYFFADAGGVSSEPVWRDSWGGGGAAEQAVFLCGLSGNAADAGGGYRADCGAVDGGSWGKSWGCGREHWAGA